MHIDEHPLQGVERRLANRGLHAESSSPEHLGALGFTFGDVGLLQDGLAAPVIGRGGHAHRRMEILELVRRNRQLDDDPPRAGGRLRVGAGELVVREHLRQLDVGDLLEHVARLRLPAVHDSRHECTDRHLVGKCRRVDHGGDSGRQLRCRDNVRRGFVECDLVRTACRQQRQRNEDRLDELQCSLPFRAFFFGGGIMPRALLHARVGNDQLTFSSDSGTRCSCNTAVPSAAGRRRRRAPGARRNASRALPCAS